MHMLKMLRKALGALDSAVVLPSLRVESTDITVTQGTSPSDVAEVSHRILFGSVKTGSLGHERKTGHY